MELKHIDIANLCVSAANMRAKGAVDITNILPSIRARGVLVPLIVRPAESDERFETIRDIGLAPLRAGGTYSDERLIRHASGRSLLVRFRARTLTPDAPLARLVMTFAPIRTELPNRELTPRERTVVAGLARGQTSKEIARDLGLSPRTVEDVRARLLRRLGARNSAELLARLAGPAF